MVFNPYNKSSLTNRGSNKENETNNDVNHNRISRGKKRTVIKCQDQAQTSQPVDIPCAMTSREYSNLKND